MPISDLSASLSLDSDMMHEIFYKATHVRIFILSMIHKAYHFVIKYQMTCEYELLLLTIIVVWDLSEDWLH